jgi:hypothetical protein
MPCPTGAACVHGEHPPSSGPAISSASAVLSPIAGAHRPAPSPSPTSFGRGRPLPRPHLRLQGPPRGPWPFHACVAGLPRRPGMDAHSLVRAGSGAGTPLLFLFFVDISLYYKIAMRPCSNHGSVHGDLGGAAMVRPLPACQAGVHRRRGTREAGVGDHGVHRQG